MVCSPIWAIRPVGEILVKNLPQGSKLKDKSGLQEPTNLIPLLCRHFVASANSALVSAPVRLIAEAATHSDIVAR